VYSSAHILFHITLFLRASRASQVPKYSWETGEKEDLNQNVTSKLLFELKAAFNHL